MNYVRHKLFANFSYKVLQQRYYNHIYAFKGVVTEHNPKQKSYIICCTGKSLFMKDVFDSYIKAQASEFHVVLHRNFAYTHVESNYL